MSDSPIFSVRVLVALVAVGILAFVGLTFVSLVSPDLQRERDYDASAYSVSAIGHKALVETLRASGRTVLVSRGYSAVKAGPGNLLLAVEQISAELLKKVVGTARSARTTLIVLPKWLIRRH